MTEAQSLRAAILAARLEASNFGEQPDAAELYVPPSHLKALRPDAHVVVGGCGVGKSFWTGVLQSEPLRGLLPNDTLKDMNVRLGFGNLEDDDRYPNADTFARFIDDGGDPYNLWRAVILRWVVEQNGRTLPVSGWAETAMLFVNDPENTAKLMEHPRGWRGLILFDALDRLSNDWGRMDDIVRGLLRATLWLKGHPGLYAKVFLREDQAERTVFDFPDASKLYATCAELTWERHDLHGLLWQRLINAPGEHGEIMRRICPSERIGDVWRVADDMKRETTTQRNAFERLAGSWMGRDRRRGVPYTWAVGHLADGRGRTSPRSFLSAIRQVAQDTDVRYPDHGYALHYESIKRGIQKASEIRVVEVTEDYPWAREVLSELSGMNVPCAYEDVLLRWQKRFPDGPQGIHSERLPAQHAARGWDGIREDLQRLGLIEERKDGRVDMPDLYRVGFGLGRKGGVKPRN